MVVKGRANQRQVLVFSFVLSLTNSIVSLFVNERMGKQSDDPPKATQVLICIAELVPSMNLYEPPRDTRSEYQRM